MSITKPGRPLSVTLLILGVLSIAGIHLIRLVRVAQNWDLLKTWLPFSPVLLAGISLFIVIGGLVIAISLWLGRPSALIVTKIGVIAYLMYYWIVKLFVIDPSIGRGNINFQIVIAMFVLIFTIWTTSNQKVKYYFGD